MNEKSEQYLKSIKRKEAILNNINSPILDIAAVETDSISKKIEDIDELHKNIELFVVDVGGVLRDTQKLDSKSFEIGFKSCNLDYKFDSESVWHLKGLGQYKNRKKCINALLAISDINKENELDNILKKPDAEDYVMNMVKNYTDKTSAAEVERITQIIYDEYGEFFNSEEGKKLVETIPGSEYAMKLLKEKGYKVALFSNGGHKAVERDVPYYNILDAVICKEDITKEKPSGEGIIKAAEKLGVALDNVCEIGDTVVDIWASRDAGCKSLIVLDHGMSFPEQIAREKPDFVFQNILHLAETIKHKNTSTTATIKIKIKE